MRKYLNRLFLICVLFMIFSPLADTQAAQKKISAVISRESVTVGRQLQIETKIKHVIYETNDPKIATVSTNGVITAKKAGNAVISVKRKGYLTKKFDITVKPYGKYPSIPVTLDEIEIALDCQDGQVDAVVRNYADSGSVKKIEYIYEADFFHKSDGQESSDEQPSDTKNEMQAEDTREDVEEQTERRRFCIQTGKLAAGAEKSVSVEGDFGNTDLLELRLLRVHLYTGHAILNYNMTTGHMVTSWDIRDTTPPTITGWVGKNGYNSKDVYMVAYSDKEYDFTRYVQASDDMGGRVKLTVDTDRINWKKSGVYTITYRAEDLAGNVAKKKAKVQVRAVGELDRMADSVLKNIVNDSWSDQKKAEAIYRYMRKNYSYVDSNDHASWERSALYGLRYHSGNCFVYYSVSRLLLTRCGIPNIEVKRAGGTHGHWWNYVYIDDGWYHFDTTPRRRRATFCLVTDAQLTAYSQAAGNSHRWDKSLLPKCATKKISAVHWGKLY